MMNKIKKFNEYINESVNIDNEIKEYVLNNYNSDDILVDCIRMKYGETVPLYHATDVGSSKIIETEGLKPVEFSKNRTTGDDCIYFQIGSSNYVSDMRPILYKWDCPISIIEKYGYVDTDSVYLSDDELIEMGFDINDIPSESLDFLSYFVANDYTIDGMEIFLANRDNDPNFPKIFPKRIN